MSTGDPGSLQVTRKFAGDPTFLLTQNVYRCLSMSTGDSTCQHVSHNFYRRLKMSKGDGTHQHVMQHVHRGLKISSERYTQTGVTQLSPWCSFTVMMTMSHKYSLFKSWKYHAKNRDFAICMRHIGDHWLPNLRHHGPITTAVRSNDLKRSIGYARGQLGCGSCPRNAAKIDDCPAVLIVTTSRLLA